MTTLIKPKDGVQGIYKVGEDSNLLYQSIILVQDADDRGTRTGICKKGLPGGGIEDGETWLEAMFREAGEELGIKSPPLNYFGTYEKERSNGINDNHLCEGILDSAPEVFGTQDKKEVSLIITLPIGEILNLALFNEIHEGTVRLLLYYLKGQKRGSLNQIVRFENYRF